MFAIIPVSSVGLSTVQGVSDYWVKLPIGFPPIRNLYTAGVGGVTTGVGAFIYRKKADSTVTIHSCEAAFDEDVPANTTVTLDTTDFKVGSASNKFTFAAAAAAGIIVTDSISSSLNTLRDIVAVEFWAKCSVATAASDFKLHLDEHAKCVSPLASLGVPALTAGVWRHCRVAVADASTLIAIISVGVELDVDVGACDFWIDDIKGVKSFSMQAEALTIDSFIPDDLYFALSAAVPAYDNDHMLIFLAYEGPGEDTRASN